jgi:hypothetical protein
MGGGIGITRRKCSENNNDLLTSKPKMELAFFFFYFLQIYLMGKVEIKSNWQHRAGKSLFSSQTSKGLRKKWLRPQSLR